MKLKDTYFKILDYFWMIATKFDLFSQHIMFTYKGQSTFSTFFGGFVSLLIFAMIGAYTTILFREMIDRK